MSVWHWLAGALLVAGVAVLLAACVGLVVARDAFDALHLVAPAGVLGAVLVCAAVLVNEGFSNAGIHAALVGGVLLVSNPVLTHATGLAVRVREARR